jgi:aspartate kinase
MNTTKTLKPILVLKFGGATLADSGKIRMAAGRVAALAKSHSVIVAVSAMGQTTNELIELAHEISAQPLRREMDMLLSVGERISMSLLSMALNDLGCPAISFTGSQAGILTDDSHVNALITEIKPFRVEEALAAEKVVIIAGFQGVSPRTKEVTTLGRGGTDTTAVALAAHFKAVRCDILKDVAGIYTADPKIVPDARPLKKLNYEVLLEMTFWGAKVLHYRSVELAKHKNVPLYIGPASDVLSDGTLIQKGMLMFESIKVLSINSHETVLRCLGQQNSLALGLSALNSECERGQIGVPQILSSTLRLDTPAKSESKTKTQVEFLLTGPAETLAAFEKILCRHAEFRIDPEKLASVSLTCSGATSPLLVQNVLSVLETNGISSRCVLLSAMSVNLILSHDDRHRAIKALHKLVEEIA